MERGDVKIAHQACRRLLCLHLWPASYPAARRSACHAAASQLRRPLQRLSAPRKRRESHIIKSPIVGTFYEAASPGSPAFVKEGDTVAVGQVLCIVEAMKLMNEIESEAAGQIVKILVSNGQPVEYGQPLFKIRTK